MPDALAISEAVKHLRTGVSLAEVAETVGKDFTAADWTAVHERLPPLVVLKQVGPSLLALIERVRSQEQAARDEAAGQIAAETAREQTALSREQTRLAREQTALSRTNLVVVPLLALITTAIGVGVALYIGHQTVDEMHFTAGVQTLLALHREFESEPMHRTRAPRRSLSEAFVY
jgi:hypothetical protein